jgi:hypothetical protein
MKSQTANVYAKCLIAHQLLHPMGHCRTYVDLNAVWSFLAQCSTPMQVRPLVTKFAVLMAPMAMIEVVFS